MLHSPPSLFGALLVMGDLEVGEARKEERLGSRPFHSMHCHSSVHLLCHLGQVTFPLWASVN